ncbi:MAG: bacillithiol biosynthesis cysteine-adding enzyme BshC [bacterium]|nr:bacillithiol biosynthesis cysteine-adding enzyme BshC [bacterium]
MRIVKTIPFTLIPGSSRLFLDYLAQSNELAAFYTAYPTEIAYPTVLAKIQATQYPRNELVEILIEQNQSFGAPELTVQNIKQLENHTTVAIVTGQQVGLFGGPLYTVYKILTAIRLAQSLKEQYSIPTVPMFWLAADDHDFSEINHITILDKFNHVVTLEYTSQNPTSTQSAGYMVFDQQINEVIAQLESSLFDTEFKSAVFTRLRDCYQPGKNFATAFGQWMTRLFGNYGLVFVNPTDARIRRLASPLYKKEIAEQANVKQAIRVTTNALLEKGYHRQVAVQEDKTNLFIDYSGTRHPIRIEGERYVFPGTNMKYTAAELIDLIDQCPERFSPNVLLRPIIEDALIPTLAYIAGPNELAYYAQCKGLYEVFGIQMPIVVPRVSITMVEKKIADVLDKYHIELGLIFENAEKTISDTLNQSLPQAIDFELNRLKEQIERQFQQLNETVTQWEPSMKEAIMNSRNSVLHQVRNLEQKIGLAHRKKSETVREQLKKLVNHILPNRDLQERTFNIIPYLIKYNVEFIDRLYSTIDKTNNEHQILDLR